MAAGGGLQGQPASVDVEVNARLGLAEPIIRAKVVAGSDAASKAECSSDDVVLRNVAMHDYGKTVLGLTPAGARRRQKGAAEAQTAGRGAGGRDVCGALGRRADRERRPHDAVHDGS